MTALGKPLRILVLSTFGGTNANVIRDYLFSFNAYSRHKYYYVFDCTALDEETDYNSFDVILIFWSLYLLQPSMLSEKVHSKIRKAAARKVLFLQDEYRDVRSFNQVMSELGVNVMFTCVGECYHALFYPPELIPTLEATYTVLPGYVPTYLERLPVDTSETRPIDVSYRSRELPYYLGDLARHKVTVAKRFALVAESDGLRADISVREQDRIYGVRWVKFLQSSRCVLGSPSGASVVDFSGQIRRDSEAYFQMRPGASYAEVRERYFADAEGRVVIDTVSPRVFEAAALGCTLVHVEGLYSGVIHPGEHYIGVKRDYSNLEEVVAAIKDRGFCRRVSERAHQDLIASKRYSYRTFVQEFDRRLADHVPRRTAVMTVSRAIFYARAYAEHGQRILPFRDRPVTVPTLMPLAPRILMAWERSRVKLGRLGKGFLAVYVALANVNLRRLLLSYVMMPRAWSAVPIGRLLNDLLKLEVIWQARAGVVIASISFEVAVEYTGGDGLTLKSVPPRFAVDGSRAGSEKGSTATKLETAVIDGRIRQITWDHSALGQHFDWEVRGLSVTIGLGTNGVHRFDALSHLYGRAPARIGTCLLSILCGGGLSIGAKGAGKKGLRSVSGERLR